MMGLSANAWHWTAAEFYASTAHEYFGAYEVYREINKDPDPLAGAK